MNIVSKFTTRIISKLVTSVLRKKLGYNVDIQLNEIKASITDGKTHLHLDVDADIDKDDLIKILKGIGLEES